MKHFEIIKVQHPNANPELVRLNIENLNKLAESGFPSGQKFNIEYYPEVPKVIVEACDNGERVISPKNFKYRDGVRVGSRLDIKNASVTECFQGEDEVMVIQQNNRLIFCQTPKSKSIKDRIALLADTIINNKTFNTASLFSGVGTADIGEKNGLDKAGIKSELTFVNDIESTFVDTLVANNPAYSKRNTVTAAMDMNELWPSALPENVHIWSCGIVCKAHSKLNVVSRSAPEWDDNYGHLTTSTLMTLQMTGFKSPIIVVEQVMPYFDSLSFHQLKRILGIKGYKLHLAGDFDEQGNYKGVQQSDYGCVENRTRLFACFATEGININFDYMYSLKRRNTKPINTMLEPKESIDPKAFQIGAGLKVKSETTAWRNIVVPDDVTNLGLVNATYGRVQMESPKLLEYNDHPKGNFRLFTDLELCRFKQLPESLVDGVAAKRDRYAMLGNGLNGGASEAFYYAIGKSLTCSEQPWSTEKKLAA